MTLLSISPAAPAVGQAISLSALVTGYQPSGTVSFYDNGVLIGSAAVESGIANLNGYIFTARYSGNANNTVSASPAIPFTMSIASSVPGTVIKGKPLSITATVNGYAPTGSVVFKVDGVAQGAPIPLSGGSATFSSSTLSAGNHTITAEYSGDSQNEASSVSLVQRVFDPASILPILQMLLD